MNAIYNRKCLVEQASEHDRQAKRVLISYVNNLHNRSKCYPEH